MPKPFIIVATPCFGGMVTHAYMMSILQLAHAATREGLDIEVIALGGDALISRARSTLVARFLGHHNATHLLFVDADIAFAPEQVFRLLGFDKDFAAAMYPLKQVEWGKLPIRALAGESLEAAGLSYVGKPCDMVPDLKVENGFATAHYAGTGFQLITRGVFERMIAAYPETRFNAVDVATNDAFPKDNFYALFDCIIDPRTKTYLSEDYSFCQRWQAIGGEIWLDLQSRLTHVGLQQFRGDTSFRFASLAEQEEGAPATHSP